MQLWEEFKDLNDDLNIAHKNFQDQLKDVVLNSYNVHRRDGKAKYIIRRLYKAYLANPQQLPDKTIQSLFREYKERDNTLNFSDLRNILEIKKKHNFASEKYKNQWTLRHPFYELSVTILLA